MSNMGYCRFENTYKDLLDCSEHMEDEELSEREIKYRQKMIKLCQEIAEDNSDDVEDDNFVYN